MSVTDADPCVHCGHQTEDHQLGLRGEYSICLAGDCDCDGSDGPLDPDPPSASDYLYVPGDSVTEALRSILEDLDAVERARHFGIAAQTDKSS